MEILYLLPSQINSLLTGANIKKAFLLFSIYISYGNQSFDEFGLIFHAIFERWIGRTVFVYKTKDYL